MLGVLPDQLGIRCTREGSAATVELHGELDLAVEARLVAEFHGLLASDPAIVIVDLRDLTFLDARGLRAITELRASCEQRDRRLVLVRGQRAVQRLLALCDLERTFEFVDRPSEALELDGPHERLFRR